MLSNHWCKAASHSHTYLSPWAGRLDGLNLDDSEDPLGSYTSTLNRSFLDQQSGSALVTAARSVQK